MQCEGFGGIPYGDKNEEIHLTSCSPANVTIDSKELVRPIWSSRMTMDPYYAVQIGPKKDPFCFQVIPENSSVGSLCYQPQTGDQSYEMRGKYNSLRFDVNLKTGTGNVTSSVIAQDKYLWIVNKLFLGVTQCICTAPKEGGDATTNDVFPLQYNWTNHLDYIGREDINIEYIYETRRLDHWVYGPHHVWTVPETGSIIRMWQPFNGLQVIPNGTLESAIDESKFKTIPPKECTSASKLTIKIKCNSDGYPANKTKKAAVVRASPEPAGVARTTPGHALWRAQTKVPRAGRVVVMCV